MSGHWFLFRSRCGSRLKILLWDRDGFLLVYKRLEAGVFKLPKLAPGTRSIKLKASELAMLLDGIDLLKLKRTPRYQRPNVSVASSGKTNEESVTAPCPRRPL